MKIKTGFLAATIALSLPLILGVYRVWPHAEENNWQQAESAAPAGLMAQVTAEQLHPDSNILSHQMKVLKLWQLGQTTPLYLIDSRIAHPSGESNPLCGVLGCAFLGYIPIQDGSYQNVLSLYLNPNLPPETVLIQAGGSLANGMPELLIHQMEGTQMLKLRLALNDERYEVVETQYLPAQHD